MGTAASDSSERHAEDLDFAHRLSENQHLSAVTEGPPVAGTTCSANGWC